ncbi:MAG: ABC transporter substrate-binding protein [Anaerolineae bacterium]
MSRRYIILMSVFASLLVCACQPLPASGEVPPLKLVLISSRTPSLTPSVTATATPWPTVRFTAMPTPSPTPPLEVTATPVPASRSWAQRVGLLSPLDVPWEQLLSEAVAEANVVIYTDSGRAMTALQELTLQVPDLTADGYVADSLDVYLRLQSETERGQHLADVVLVSDPALIWGLLQQNRVWTYVPPDLAGPLDGAVQNGLLTHHWTAVTWVYNTRLGEPAITSWWDLTEPAWTGRVVMADPRADERTFYLLAAMDEHAVQLASAYRARYGRDLLLDETCPNAACQWFKALLANSPVLLYGDADVAQYVGSADVEEVRIGLCGLEQLAQIQPGKLSIYPLVGLEPFAGLLSRTYIAIVDQAPHPQAAKLAVRWLFGDAGCARGWDPYCMPGFYSPRSDIPDPQGAPAGRDLLPRLWEANPQYLVEHQLALRDWVNLLLKDIPLTRQTP